MQLIILLAIIGACNCAIDHIKVYRNEVNNTIKEHIVSKTLAFLESGNTYVEVATLLAQNMNETYGSGWQVLSRFNISLNSISLPHEPNTLFYFSYNEYHFYLFKFSHSANTNDCTGIDIFERALQLARISTPLITANYGFNENNARNIMNSTLNVLRNNIDTWCFDDTSLHGSYCFDILFALVGIDIRPFNLERYTMSMGEKHFTSTRAYSQPGPYFYYMIGDFRFFFTL